MFFEKLIEFLTPFFNEQGFALEGEDSFVKEDKKVRINYNEAKKVYELYFKEENAEEAVISAYLFDETQTAKDIEAVAIDFIDTLKKQLGVKKEKNKAEQVALPDELGGEKVGIGGLTQKLLAIFPQYKETYKEHVAKYGKLLMVDFCHEYFIPSVKELIRGSNKRQIKKFYDAMCDMYIAADAETTPYVVGILASAVYEDKALLEALKENTEQCPSLYVSVLNLSNSFKHNKKLRNCF